MVVYINVYMIQIEFVRTLSPKCPRHESPKLIVGQEFLISNQPSSSNRTVKFFRLYTYAHDFVLEPGSKIYGTLIFFICSIMRVFCWSLRSCVRFLPLLEKRRGLRNQFFFQPLLKRFSQPWVSSFFSLWCLSDFSMPTSHFSHHFIVPSKFDEVRFKLWTNINLCHRSCFSIASKNKHKNDGPEIDETRLQLLFMLLFLRFS